VTPGGRLDAASGARQFIVGTGGAPLYRFTTSREAHSEVRSRAAHGVSQLTLGEGTYAWSFVPVEVDTFTDAGSGACH